MQTIIQRIQIHRFRSFIDETIDAKQINIYSGKNNSGKSNILRALNLFFNFNTNHNTPFSHHDDYNKAMRDAAGGKRDVRISIQFAPSGDAALSSPFTIIRTFHDGGQMPDTEYHSSNPKIEEQIRKKNGRVTRQFTLFLNKIKYIYVPAIRDKHFVKNMFLDFEQIVKDSVGNEELDKAVNHFSSILNASSMGISNDFVQYMGLPAEATLSSRTSDLLNGVEILIKTGLQTRLKATKKSNGGTIKNIPISLFSSGDGIIMAYLAYFLNYLTTHSNQNFVWGFEEPENSLEYSKVEELADAFLCNFSKQAQIFITTHSPAFINLKDKNNVASYRVYTKPQSKQELNAGLPDRKPTLVKSLDNIKKQLSLLSYDDPAYAALDEELHLSEQSKKISEILDQIHEEKERLEKTRASFAKRMHNLLPSKIFICEDKNAVSFWKAMLTKIGISDILVESSKGCENNAIET